MRMGCARARAAERENASEREYREGKRENHSGDERREGRFGAANRSDFSFFSSSGCVRSFTHLRRGILSASEKGGESDGGKAGARCSFPVSTSGEKRNRLQENEKTNRTPRTKSRDSRTNTHGSVSFSFWFSFPPSQRTFGYIFIRGRRLPFFWASFYSLGSRHVFPLFGVLRS